MQTLWKIFGKRRDIEYSFVVSVCGGLLLVTFAMIMGLGVFRDFFTLLLLIVWLIFSFYFIVAVRGYHKSK